MSKENENMAGPVKKQLARLKIDVTTERGLEIYLQSQHNFSILANPKQGTFKLGGVDCMIPLGGDGYQIPGVMGCFRTQKECFQHDGFLNLSMLLARDLQKGVTFNFGLFPINEEKVLEYIQGFKQQTKLIYLTYMKPISVSVTFSTETVELSSDD